MIGTLGEVILYVEDMPKQVRFYRDVLGLKVIDPADSDPGDAYWVLLDCGACQLALHGGGERRFGEDAPKIVFMVDDIQAARDELVRKGVPAGDTFSPAPGVSVVNCTDPEGNKFSLEKRDSK
ncbi:MAG: VOC family protein [Planctomycetaceae bacterium]